MCFSFSSLNIFQIFLHRHFIKIYKDSNHYGKQKILLLMKSSVQNQICQWMKNRNSTGWNTFAFMAFSYYIQHMLPHINVPKVMMWVCLTGQTQVPERNMTTELYIRSHVQELSEHNKIYISLISVSRKDKSHGKVLPLPRFTLTMWWSTDMFIQVLNNQF